MQRGKDKGKAHTVTLYNLNVIQYRHYIIIRARENRDVGHSWRNRHWPPMMIIINY